MTAVFSRHVGAPTSVELIESPDVLERLGSRLDALHAETGTPITARRPWLRAWVNGYPQYEPFAVAVRDATGDLAAVALLASRRGRAMTEVVALGHRTSDQVRLPARSAEAAAQLADGVAAHLARLPRPWRLVVRNLPEPDPVAEAIAARVTGVLAAGDVSPVVRFGADRSVRAHVSANHHGQVRRMHNRMRRDGLLPVVAHLRAVHEIETVLGEVAGVCRRRDAAMRGRSFLDERGGETFFREVVLEHARRGEAQLTTLRLGGELAAYVLCFLDGGAYRVWNTRVAPEWTRYGAGRMANSAALERALADPRATELDWMRGEEEYKHSMSNAVVRAQDLLAWSGPAVKTLFDAPRRLKVFVKGVTWLRPVLASAKGLRARARRGRARTVRLSLRLRA